MGTDPRPGEQPQSWYVDLDAERVEVYRLEHGRYGAPLLVVFSDEVLETPILPGFSIRADEALGAPPTSRG